MDTLERLLKNRADSQAYRWHNSVDIDDIARLANQYGFRFFYLNGNLIRTMQDLFDQTKTVMEFPFFGNNWDALLDCMRDLSWFSESGFLLLYDYWEHFAQSAPDDFRIAIEIFQDVVEDRRKYSELQTMYVLLRDDSSATLDLPILVDD